MKKFIYILILTLCFAFTAEAQKKEATFSIDPTGTLYKDVGPMYGGCFTVAWMYDPVSILGNGADTINLEVSLDGTSYTPLSASTYVFSSLTIAPNTVIWDTLCYPYYRLSVTSGIDTITDGYIRTTLYFIRID